MRQVGVYEAKTHLPQLLYDVERGETITITRHGKAVAQLAPAVASQVRSPQEVEDILAEFRAFQDEHRGALRGLDLQELIESGRRY